MNIRLQDLLDIALVAFLLYQSYKLVAQMRAMNLLRGLLVFGLALLVANRLELKTLSFLLSQVATLGLFALVVVFQPELRAILEHLGRSRIRESSSAAVADEIARAVERLAAKRTGALIALERGTPLGEYARTGVHLEAQVSTALLETIFNPATPLHDGGVILHGDRILAAGCLFPHTESLLELGSRLGTRHRAALGLAELSDALVIVVSEERGSIRVAEASGLSKALAPHELQQRLRDALENAPRRPQWTAWQRPLELGLGLRATKTRTPKTQPIKTQTSASAETIKPEVINEVSSHD